MARFARRSLKLDSVAIIEANGNIYSKGLCKSFAKTFTEEGGKILGYVMYRTKEHETLGVADGLIQVTELVAETDAAYSALWEFVFGIDLIGTIEAPWRRIDEPLPWMLTDPRQLHRTVSDTLWVRLVDVPAALAGRRYLSEGSLVIAVVDQFCTWNAGSYLIEGGPGGATCSPTTRTPDITLNANDLGAVFLGGVRFNTLARANRIEGSAQSIRLADIDLFAGASGPGGFTGVRIGLAAVKGLGEVMGKPVVAVSNLLALSQYGSAALRATVIDARRGEVFAALYSAAQSQLTAALLFCVVSCRVMPC